MADVEARLRVYHATLLDLTPAESEARLQELRDGGGVLAAGQPPPCAKEIAYAALFGAGGRSRPPPPTQALFPTAPAAPAMADAEPDRRPPTHVGVRDEAAVGEGAMYVPLPFVFVEHSGLALPVSALPRRPLSRYAELVRTSQTEGEWAAAASATDGGDSEDDGGGHLVWPGEESVDAEWQNIWRELAGVEATLRGMGGAEAGTEAAAAGAGARAGAGAGAATTVTAPTSATAGPPATVADLTWDWAQDDDNPFVMAEPRPPVAAQTAGRLERRLTDENAPRVMDEGRWRWQYGGVARAPALSVTIAEID